MELYVMGWLKRISYVGGIGRQMPKALPKVVFCKYLPRWIECWYHGFGSSDSHHRGTGLGPVQHDLVHQLKSKLSALHESSCPKHVAKDNNKLLVTKGIATRSPDATSSSWHYY